MVTRAAPLKDAYFSKAIGGISIPEGFSFRTALKQMVKEVGQALWEGVRIAEGHLWRIFDNSHNWHEGLDMWRLIRQATMATACRGFSRVRQPTPGLDITIQELTPGSDSARQFDLAGSIQIIDYEVGSYVKVALKNYTDRALYRNVAQ